MRKENSPIKKKKDKTRLKNSQLELLGVKTKLVRGSQSSLDYPPLLSPRALSLFQLSLFYCVQCVYVSLETI